MPTPLPIDRPLRLAVVGLGQIAELVLPTYLERDDVVIVAICDRDEAQLDRWRARCPDARATTSLDELLTVAADVVDVLVPTPLHAEVVEQVFRAGYHVQVQKPLARDVEGAERMLAARDAAGATLRVLEDYLFFPPLVKMRDLIVAGEIGDPVSVHMKIVATGRGGWELPERSMRWQFEQMLDGRGMMVFDHGWHQLAVASWLFGPIRRIFAWLGETEIVPGIVMDAPSTLIWEHETGVRALLDITFAIDMYFRSSHYTGDERIEVTGTRGYVRTNRISAQGVQEPAVLLYRDGETREFHDLDDRPPDAFRASTAHALAFYRGEEAHPVIGPVMGPVMGPEESLHVLTALVAALESHRLGHAVDVVRDTDVMAEDVGLRAFFPEVFRPGVPDIQPALRTLIDRERIHRGEDGHVTILHLDDVLEVTKRRDVHSMDPEIVELAGAYMGAGRPLIPLMLDGDAHTKYRKLLDPLFAPKVVAQLATRVRALADELIDGFVADGRVELYNTFCEPLPSMVFLTLLGLPLDDLDFLIWFKNGIIRPDDDDHRATANTKMIEYLYAELDRREARGEPGDDLIGGFITAEVDGETLTREDVIDITFLLVLAGLDTVAASLSCMVDWLARHPDQRQRLLDDPALLPAAIEELMRFETPVVAGGRYATADFELGGEQIKAGDHLTVCWAAANLDGDGFDDALTVDFDRAAKRHIAFASGFHRCLGSHLARMELSIILTALHERIPDYALDPEQAPGYNNTMIRTIDPLPLVFTPGS